jgi:vacuolar-type H+-ATPase subunit C/Vma6
MKSLARYATTNAITRTMLSELLSRQDFESIVRSESVERAWLSLTKTSYQSWLPEDPPSDVMLIDRILREVTAGRFRRAMHSLTGEPRRVATILLSRWDLDNLAFALRLWHSKDTGLLSSLTFPSFVHDIPIYDVVEAETIEEIALLLRHTPYIEPVSASVKMYRDKGSILFVEIALERDHYARLLAAIRGLGGADTVKAHKIIAAEIDVINLSWLARLTEYYEVQPGSFHNFAIPGPSEISRRLSEPGLTSEGLKEIRSDFASTWMPGGVEGEIRIESIALMESITSEMAVGAARSLLAGYPFSIGCVLAFYLLKRTELANLQTVFGGKALGSSDAEILGRLHGLR